MAVAVVAVAVAAVAVAVAPVGAIGVRLYSHRGAEPRVTYVLLKDKFVFF